MTDKETILRNEESMKSMSDYLSTQMHSIATNYGEGDYASISVPMTRVEQQICRQFYLTVIDGIWEKNKTENGWLEARRQFDLVLETAEKTLKQNEQAIDQDLAASHQEKTIILNVDGNLYSFQVDELKNKSMGRIPFTDMPFQNQSSTESRLHAIVHAFPSLGLIAVIDLGSAAGITMLERSNPEAPLTKSMPNDRRPLVIGIDECAVFQLGHGRVRLTINPKKCIICEENYRDFVGACGHFICCQGCADQWRNQGIGQRRCPACNQTFFGPDAIQNAAAHVMTMQNHD